jgi:hypothetical protein
MVGSRRDKSRLGTSPRITARVRQVRFPHVFLHRSGQGRDGADACGDGVSAPQHIGVGPGSNGRAALRPVSAAIE